MKVEHCNGVRRYSIELRETGTITIRRDGRQVGWCNWDDHHGLWNVPMSLPPGVRSILEEKLKAALEELEK